jgi:sec-independent protein translocase protein TatC
LLFFFIITFIINDKILHFISKPVGNLFFFSPVEAFTVRLKIAFLSSIFLSFPFVLYFIWRFIEPALYPNEKRIIIIALVFVLILFYAGSLLSIFVVTPYGVKFLMNFSGEDLKAIIRASEYVNFLFFMTVSFGLLFQIPVVMVILSSLRLVNPRIYSKHRKIIIVFIFIISAIITPSVDAFSLLVLATPLVVIFEVGILVSKLFYKNDKN